MRQVIVGGHPDLLNNTRAEYNSIAGCQDWSTNENLRHQLISSAGTIKNLIVELDGVAGDGKTWTFTVMINGSPSALTCDITGDTDTEGSDITNEVSVSAGDEIDIRSTSSGSPTIRSATWAFDYLGDTAKESLFLGFTTSFKSQARFCGIAGVFVSAPDEFEAYQIMPTAGKIKKLYVELTNNPGTDPDAYRYTLRLNKATSDLTVTIAGAAITGNNTSDEITVAAGDSVGLYIEPLNGPSNDVWAYFGFTFVADTDGESCVLGGQFASPSVSVTSFMTITTSTLSFGPTEIDSRQLIRACVLKKFYVEVTTDPGSGNSWDLTVRKNEASTALTVNIAGTDTTGNDTENTVPFSDFDYATIKIDPTSSPVQTSNGMKWAMVMVVPDATPGFTWAEQTRHHFINESGIERSYEGFDTGVDAEAGHLFVEGTYLHYFDENGDERRQQGYKLGATGVETGHIWIEGVNFHYIDANGDERYLPIEGGMDAPLFDQVVFG